MLNDTYFQKQKNNDSPLWKITIAAVGILAILALGASYFSRQAMSSKAAEYAARANDDFRNQHYDRALSEINEALDLNERPEYLETKANLLLNRGEVNQVGLLLNRLLELEPANAHYYFAAGNNEYTRGYFDKALQDYSTAYKLESHNTTYGLAKANLLAQTYHPSEAIALFKALIQTDPNNRETWNQLAIYYTNNGQKTDALTVRLKAVQRFPRDEIHYLCLGQLYESMGKKSEAVAAFTRSLEIHPQPNTIAAEQIYHITGHRVNPRLENLATNYVPFQSLNNIMFVVTDINHERGRFIIDTGASISVVFAHAAAKYHLAPTGLTSETQTASKVINVPITYGDVRLGKYTIEHAAVAISPDLEKLPHADGIIGMNVLGNFKLSINHLTQQFELSR